MARFDFYPDGDDFLLDVQATALDGLDTRAVIPLRAPQRAPLPARRLNPQFTLDGKNFVLVTQFISAIPASELRRPVGDLRRHHDEIVAALDMLFQGF